ncbi:MAG: hypothetical protein BM556_04855 [Bacteriovorax sp. MedPE-SWde]|nr:MAG: hypothetical protein BM556_04855 [Bacteriovorax sp. MedPE-SWde]
MGARNLEFEIEEAQVTEEVVETRPKPFNFLSVLFTLSLLITSTKLFSASYLTLKSMYSPEIFVSMTLTFNELYQRVVFSAYIFEIALSAIFASLYIFNFYSAIKRKKGMKNIFLMTQGTYLCIVVTYNFLVNKYLGSEFQTGLVLSNALYLGLWYSYLNYSERAKSVFTA